MPIRLLIFLEILVMWVFQLILWSMWTPRYLIEVSWISIWLFIDNITCLGSFLWIGRKITKFDLSIFNESLFAHSQLKTFSSSELIKLSSMFMSLCWKDKFASSAKRWKSRSFEQLWKSLTYIKNKSGPSTDPWGTPQDTAWVSEFIAPRETNCDLLLKYEVNQSLTTPLTP